jgi:hypothetical protein
MDMLDQIFVLESVGNHFLRQHSFSGKCQTPAISHEENAGQCDCEDARELRKLWKAIKALSDIRKQHGL